MFRINLLDNNILISRSTETTINSVAVVFIWMLLKYYSSTKKAFIRVYTYKTSMDPRKCFYSLITHLTADTSGYFIWSPYA